jgi:hypothetical protein
VGFAAKLKSELKMEESSLHRIESHATYSRVHCPIAESGYLRFTIVGCPLEPIQSVNGNNRAPAIVKAEDCDTKVEQLIRESGVERRTVCRCFNIR